jgi:hypothetical protein
MEVIEMKKFMLGFLTCLLLSATVVYGASAIKEAYFNEGLKLAVNGAQSDVKFVTVEIEGERYGRNYVSVADFIKALNDNAGLSATVDFDSKTQTIIVDSKVIESTVEDTTKTDTGGDIVSDTVEKITQTPDGITYIDTWQGKQYIGEASINRKINEKNYYFVPNVKTDEWMLIKGISPDFNYRFQTEESEYAVIIQNVPTISTYYPSVTVEYYINEMLPYIK